MVVTLGIRVPVMGVPGKAGDAIRNTNINDASGNVTYDG